MSDRINVTVDEAKRNITLGFDVGALSRSVVIDLADMKSVMDGLTAVISISQQHIQGQVNALAQRLQALERLSKDDLECLARLVRQHPREVRADGKPTTDELAGKLEMLKAHRSLRHSRQVEHATA